MYSNDLKNKPSATQKTVAPKYGKNKKNGGNSEEKLFDNTKQAMGDAEKDLAKVYSFAAQTPEQKDTVAPPPPEKTSAMDPDEFNKLKSQGDSITGDIQKSLDGIKADNPKLQAIYEILGLFDSKQSKEDNVSKTVSGAYIAVNEGKKIDLMGWINQMAKTLGLDKDTGPSQLYDMKKNDISGLLEKDISSLTGTIPLTQKIYGQQVTELKNFDASLPVSQDIKDELDNLASKMVADFQHGDGLDHDPAQMYSTQAYNCTNSLIAYKNRLHEVLSGLKPPTPTPDTPAKPKSNDTPDTPANPKSHDTPDSPSPVNPTPNDTPDSPSEPVNRKKGFSEELHYGDVPIENTAKISGKQADIEAEHLKHLNQELLDVEHDQEVKVQKTTIYRQIQSMLSSKATAKNTNPSVSDLLKTDKNKDGVDEKTLEDWSKATGETVDDLKKEDLTTINTKVADAQKAENSAKSLQQSLIVEAQEATSKVARDYELTGNLLKAYMQLMETLIRLVGS